MEVKSFEIPGPKLILPRVFEDARGYFFETFNQALFQVNGLPIGFVQDNQSLSSKGTLRGLHFQAPPFEQGKLVRVISGAVLDVIVDIRIKSKYYGKHIAIELNDSEKSMLWIPSGFAHGFLTLEDNTIFSYKCTGLYSKDHEGGVLWSDEKLGIDWGNGKKIISEKDIDLAPFSELVSPFKS